MNPSNQHIQKAQTQLQTVVNTLLASPIMDNVDLEYATAKDRIGNAVQVLENFTHESVTLDNAVVNQRMKLYNIREWFKDPIVPVYSDVLVNRLNEIITDLKNIQIGVRMYGSGVDIYGDPVPSAEQGDD